MSEKTTRHFMDDDAGTSPQASYTTDMAAELDTDLDMLRELCALPDPQAAVRLAQWLDGKRPREEAIILAAEMFRLFLCQILFSRRPRHEAWLWAIATGMECAEGRDMADVGKMFGISKQAVSKQVNCRLDKFNLPRSRYVNSQAARNAQAKAYKDKHGLAIVRKTIRTDVSA